jgi:hypothetical protein
VTGIVLPLDDVVRASDDPRLAPTAYFTPALARALDDAGVEQAYAGKLVRLRHGAADIAAFESAARALVPDTALNFQETEQTAERARRANRPYVVTLWCFATIAALAAIAIVGQALARSQRFQDDDLSTLRSLGASRGSTFAYAMARGAGIGVLGAVVAVGIAVLASPLTPIGPLRPLELDRGFAADWTVLLSGAAAIVLLGIAATLAGLREFKVRRGPRLRFNAGGADVPLPFFTGARFAFDTGRGPTTVPLRSTLLGVTLAIGALVASIVYGAGLTQFTSTPSRYGWSWDYQVEFEDKDVTQAALARDHDVAAVALGGYGQLGIGGRNVSAVGVESARGVPSVPILDGRAPTRANEVVLGRTTMHQLHVALGDAIVAEVGDTKRTLTVVGDGVFPRFAPYPGSDPTGLGTGAVLTFAGLAAFDKADSEGQVGTGPGFFLVEMKDGTHTTARDLQRTLFGNDPFADGVFGPQRPNDVLSYERLDRTPTALAALLVLLGAGTAVHLFVTTVRRRRRDLAVLKAVGYTRGQVAGTVVAQASILAGLALLVGIPLGVVAGRWFWFVTANWLGIAQQVALPLAMLAAVAIVSLVGTNLVALVPGRRAAHLRPADVLRSE